MSEMAGSVFAGWPLAGALALMLVGGRLRAGRRREALNRALHEMRRPLQLLAFTPGAPLAAGPSAPLELAIAAEERGFDTAAISDHFQPWRHHGGHSPFSFAVLGALAGRVAAVLIEQFAHWAVEVARQCRRVAGPDTVNVPSP